MSFLVGNESDPMPIHLKKKGIAWWTDKNVKFRNPPGGETLEERFKGKVLLVISLQCKVGVLMRYL